MTTRTCGAGLVAVLVLAAGCGGTSHRTAVAKASAVAATQPTESTTTLPDTNAPPGRLRTAVTLDNGLWYLAPPRPTDSTSLTDAVAGDEASHNSDGSPAKPIVVLARYTDNLATIARLPAGSYAPLPHDLLVVAVLRYGIDPIPPQGQVSGPLPTGLPSYVSMVWLFDPVTGKGLYGASYPGPLPPISTSPATG